MAYRFVNAAGAPIGATACSSDATVPQKMMIPAPPQAPSTYSAPRPPPSAGTQGNPRHGRIGYGLDLTSVLQNLETLGSGKNPFANLPQPSKSTSNKENGAHASTVPRLSLPVAPPAPVATIVMSSTIQTARPRGAAPAHHVPLPLTSRQASAKSRPQSTSVHLKRNHRDSEGKAQSVEDVTPREGVLTAARALAQYEQSLSRYEQREILDYESIYFLGTKATKIDAPIADDVNFGFDDERGDYKVVLHDHICYRYEVLSELGQGSFGRVLKVYDYKFSVPCALKIIRNKKRFHQQAMVEIRILDHLRSRDRTDSNCVVRMLDTFVFRNHTVITFELHSMNLYELAKLNRYHPFAPQLIKRFTAQLLVAMSFMHREHIVHCDLKPENILLKQENRTSIKIIDFGSSCFESERVYTYIQSRFYRAPEIIMGIAYGRAIDLWSLGCIVCEMAMGFPIFPGENELEQLQCIMEVLGVPPQRMVDRSPRKKNFFEPSGAPKLTPNSHNRVRKPSSKDLQQVLRTEDKLFVDFVLQFLQWEPSCRATPNDAMRHEWIAECFYQEPANEIERRVPRPTTSGARVGSAKPALPALSIASKSSRHHMSE